MPPPPHPHPQARQGDHPADRQLSVLVCVPACCRAAGGAGPLVVACWPKQQGWAGLQMLNRAYMMHSESAGASQRPAAQLSNALLYSRCLLMADASACPGCSPRCFASQLPGTPPTACSRSHSTQRSMAMTAPPAFDRPRQPPPAGRERRDGTRRRTNTHFAASAFGMRPIQLAPVAFGWRLVSTIRELACRAAAASNVPMPANSGRRFGRSGCMVAEGTTAAPAAAVVAAA